VQLGLLVLLGLNCSLLRVQLPLVLLVLLVLKRKMKNHLIHMQPMQQ
jgi:hypothetical protein